MSIAQKQTAYYLSMVTGGEATDEHLADICPTTHVSRQMPPTFVWGVSCLLYTSWWSWC